MQRNRHRAHPLGTIYLRKDGRWTGVYELPRLHGQRHRKHVYGRSRYEVEQKLRNAHHLPPLWAKHDLREVLWAVLRQKIEKDCQ